MCRETAGAAKGQSPAYSRVTQIDQALTVWRQLLLPASLIVAGHSQEETGTTAGNPPGGLFDSDVVRCVGMSASFDGKRKGSSVCEGVAKDGARRLTYFWHDNDGKPNREAVSGTGKYDGMVTTTGTIQAVGPTPESKTGTAQLCNHHTGTYKLK